MIPYYPNDDDKGKDGYTITTTWEHLVSEYARLNIFQVEELDYFDFLQLRRDAFIHTMRQTEKGSEYLANAWRLEQTKPDRQGLRAKFGKGG